MPFEDQIAQTMRETGEEFAPRDLTRLVNGGAADGRRRRRRRNAAVVGGSAALALVALGGAMVPSLLGGPAATHRVAGPAARPGMSLTASSKPVSDAERAKELLGALEGVLPKGVISQAQARWQSSAPRGKNTVVVASLVYNDGKGAAGISVSLTRYAPHSLQLPSCPPDPAFVPNDVCHAYPVAGGGRLVVDLGYEYPAKGYGTKSWSAWLDLPDGSHLEFTEYNAATEKDSAVTRATPPLSGARLRTIALDPVWTPLLRAIPAPTIAPPAAPGGTPGAKPGATGGTAGATGGTAGATGGTAGSNGGLSH